jgi:hypothetical protein
MLTDYVVLNVDGTTTEGQAELSQVPEWEPLAAVVGPLLDCTPANMEHVNVWDGGEYRDMFVIGNGFSQGLGRNEQATVIYRANVLEHNDGPPINPEALWFISGPAVLFKRKVWY